MFGPFSIRIQLRYALPKNRRFGGAVFGFHIEVFKKNGGSEALMETKVTKGKHQKNMVKMDGMMA